MIDPENIDKEENTKSFDDVMFKNIDINVRKERLEEYQNNDFYKQFKSVSPSFMSENGEEEFIAVSANAVNLLSTTNNDYTYLLPATVNNNGKTYNVDLIGDYAFQNAGRNMKEVVVPKNVGYIGAKAFMTDINKNTSTIENIFFLDTETGTDVLSTLRFKLDDTGKDYNEFCSGQHIYVKKSAYETYINAWEKHKDVIDYRIPGISISSKYGTFSREFDTYICDYEGCNVLAFTGGEYRKGTGDFGAETEYHIHMESINAAGYDGLYIPKNTGVLLKSMETTCTPEDFYYCIGEKDNIEHEITGNGMKGVTTNGMTISGYDKWVIQGGLFRNLNGQTATMPVHKAYLQLSGVDANSKIRLVFDNGNTTDITDINTDTINRTDGYHNLNGMRVEHPQKGIYIHNNKKVIIR